MAGAGLLPRCVRTMGSACPGIRAVAGASRPTSGDPLDQESSTRVRRPLRHRHGVRIVDSAGFRSAGLPGGVVQPRCGGDSRFSRRRAQRGCFGIRRMAIHPPGSSPAGARFRHLCGSSGAQVVAGTGGGCPGFLGPIAAHELVDDRLKEAVARAARRFDVAPPQAFVLRTRAANEPTKPPTLPRS